MESQRVAYAAFGSSVPSKTEIRHVYRVNLGAGDDLFATKVPVICGPVYRPAIPEVVLQSFGDLNLADCYDVGRQVTVDILVGLDAYWKFIQGVW